MTAAGLIEKYNETDYLWWWEYKPFRWEKNPYQNLVQFNQNQWKHHWDCTIFWTLWMLEYNTWLWIDEKYTKQKWNLAREKWIVEYWVWWTFWDATNFVKSEVEKDFEVELHMDRIYILSEQVEKALEDWWACTVWFHGAWSEDWYNDVNDDWIAWKSNYDKTGGHLAYMIRKEGNYYKVDSYYWDLDYNKYKVKNLIELVRNWFVMSYVYFLYLKKVDMSKLPEHKKVEEVTDQDEKNIIAEWERIVWKAIEEKDYKTIYDVYTWSYAITRMLIDIYEIRSKWGGNF